MAKAGTVKPFSVMVNGAGTIHDFIEPVAIHIALVEAMATLAPVRARAFPSFPVPAESVSKNQRSVSFPFRQSNAHRVALV
jgi:hypothetical protein